MQGFDVTKQANLMLPLSNIRKSWQSSSDRSSGRVRGTQKCDMIVDTQSSTLRPS